VPYSPGKPWVAVVPVKDATRAKTRLTGESPTRRVDLARAFALDTVAALSSAPAIGLVVVVTSDPVLSVSWHSDSVIVVVEVQRGMNEAVMTGVAWCRRHHGKSSLAVFPADLPCATAAATQHFLELASGYDRAVLPDLEQVGTTALTARAGVAPRPSFGPRSLAAHLASGAALVEGRGLDRLRRDVDEPAHLRAAVHLGVGRHTSCVLANSAPDGPD